VDERTIDLTDSNGKHRAEDTLPGGFIPSHLAAPMLRGSAATSLEYAAMELGGIRLAADVLADPHGGLPGGDLAAAREIAETATRLQRLLRALAAGALAALVLTVGLAVAPGGSSAQAAEGPEPDPVAVVCQHSTVFARGLWLDMGQGKVYVAAPLRELVPGIGWVPAYSLEVDVQKLTRGHWLTVARLHTGSDGYARGLVRVGGGVDYLRVVHPRDSWTKPATGTTRRVVVTTEPIDIV
jgi:hypothetical protein